ncbi:MAG: NAD-dependent epimerase/dehydratase family protein, partial [Acidobacteriia bacterium]|nr:NAD-dependent epimerase/dehydratase family protein [Terriglobia bacterium]
MQLSHVRSVIGPNSTAHEIPVKNVLVTGGAGYIGSVLVRRLIGAGYRVRVLDSLLFGDSSTASLRD